MGIRVGVFGAAGRMGSEVCRAVVADVQLELVAAVDPHHMGLDMRQVARIDTHLSLGRDTEAMAEAGVSVVVDFTHLDAARRNLEWCAANGVHAVVGTSGFAERDLEWVERAFTDSHCLIAPNFAIGAVLMMRFAEMAAPWFETAEIIELHHDSKVDAPSGTAMATAQRMAAASSSWAPDPTQDIAVEGVRGGEGPGHIHIHSVRLRGLVAHQEVLLGTTGQSLTLRHDSYDRSSFMPGVIVAVKKIGDRPPGLTVGLDSFLGL